jgi:hypothetical protein
VGGVRGGRGPGWEEREGTEWREGGRVTDGGDSFTANYKK